MTESHIEEASSTVDDLALAVIADEPEWSRVLRAPVQPYEKGVLPRVTCRDCSRRQCKKHASGRCNECGAYISTAHIHLDFMGHAAVTNRLLQADIGWDWEPMAFTDDGLPFVHRTEAQLSLWIRLTIGGVTRYGVGTVGTGANEPLKELIGDAIRNAAMRFGVGLELWHKGEFGADIDPDRDAVKETKSAPARGQKPPAPDKSAAKAKAASKPAPAPPANEEPAAEASSSVEEAAGAPPGDVPPSSPPKPAPDAPGGSVKDLRDDVNATFMGLPKGEAMKQARSELSAADLWPVANIPDERLQEALAILVALDA